MTEEVPCGPISFYLWKYAKNRLHGPRMVGNRVQSYRWVRNLQ